MLYLARRSPFLSALNFNANMLRWPPHSSSCFDIILHFLCFVCRFIISWWIRIKICLHLWALLCYRLAKYSVKCAAIEHCVAPVLCRFLGHQQTWRRNEESWSLGPGWVGEKNRVELGGFLWCSLSRSEERSGDQSGLFYVAGARLWSPRVTYSTHFIKFTSVLIADQ